ncbi:unnamed protein product [Onchocerca flexuosa]|uniref:RRM domain-containing protein n=1 Tax=Onchocerca flexuosa TaxID=387005 RepID=A0A183HIS7_9BILA|nr:unnamed protein product [Onchocerca flexuosa]
MVNYEFAEFLQQLANVVNILSEGQATRRGIAIISLSSQEALVNALKLNGMELQGRSLRISLRDQSRPSFSSGRISFQNHQPRPLFGNDNIGPNNAYGHYKNSGSYHEGGYSTLPHPRRGPLPAAYHAYNSDSRPNRIPLQNCSSYRGRDNRRYDYDNRLFRHPKPGNNQFLPRFTVRPGRSRTESIRSNTTDGTEKHERRKLQLQPRTKPLHNTGEDLPARPTSIFGLAKPVDTYEKEKQRIQVVLRDSN